jgi:transcriptional regulator with XRE-family HTH domain
MSLSNEQPTIGQRIRAAYLRRGYNRSTFARAIDVHYTNVSAWETGKQRPSATNARLISNILDVPEAELYGYTEAVPDYPAFHEWMASPESREATPEQVAALQRQRWPHKPTVLTYHYMFQALRAQLPPDKAAKAAETTQAARSEAVRVGGAPRPPKKAPKRS